MVIEQPDNDYKCLQVSEWAGVEVIFGSAMLVFYFVEGDTHRPGCSQHHLMNHSSVRYEEVCSTADMGPSSVDISWCVATVWPLYKAGHTQEPDAATAQRLARAFHDLELLKRQNAELRSLFTGINIGDPSLRQEQKDALYQDLQDKLRRAEDLLERSQDINKQSTVEVGEGPSERYERLRRRISDNVQELWYFVSVEMNKMHKQVLDTSPDLATKLTRILEEGVEHKRSLLVDLQSLAEVDGFAAWREEEANELSDLVQRRLEYLQNPADCSQARKLTCNLNKGCGYGCQLHHVVYCLMVAYGTQRTLILKSKGWRYHKTGWEEVFFPLSNTCTDPNGDSHSHWPGKTDTQVVDLPIIDSLSPRPPYLPLAVPADLAPRLTRLHGDPIVWWVGQLLKYLLRPQEATSNMLRDAGEKLQFKKPIVGVHVRRTDKVGTEAAFHQLEEYMLAVDEYFDQLEMKSGPVDQRRIFLASDDPKVLAEAKTKYTNYEVIGDPVIAKSAAVHTRYSDVSLNGIIIDIHFLSMSDYLVCTFSSQVCRVAYELMQTMYPDAADLFRSLDDIYYYGGQSAHNRVAVLPHESQDARDMNLEVGDLVGVAGNHWDGFSKGKNLRTNRIGLYPSFKVVEKVEAVEFPTTHYEVLSRYLKNELSVMGEIDGFSAWRENEAIKLSDLVQRRLKFLQNPPSCDKAKKLKCGYGCQIHHLVYCMIIAYGTEHTLILDSKEWSYHKGGWEEVFQPLSNNCTNKGDAHFTLWPGIDGEDQNLLLPFVDYLESPPPYLPLAVPEDLVPRLLKFHGFPFIWWIGQILKYLLQPQETTQKLIDEAANKLNFRKPIVGQKGNALNAKSPFCYRVHIRRTDKINREADFHSVEEYMQPVEEFYNTLEMRGKTKRIYLATDDPEVFKEIKTKYPKYEVIGSPEMAKYTTLESRYSDESLNGILLDIHFLSRSDYIVCTFSSQVGRLAYEIMQAYNVDASERYFSLDDVYYYGGQTHHYYEAVYPHKSSGDGEIDLNVDDVLNINKHYFNGSSKVKNIRTGQEGLVPSFKIQEKTESVLFPTYPEVFLDLD
uniref:Alpha-(1,6)-fucosyltransferase n=1 Tax=Timema cristinae TaxID=61476 RepID=A0A7R9CLN9_TIMCR|nr:unnamed protein product [Timema cristinae]